MRPLPRIFLISGVFVIALAFAVSLAEAQPGGGKKDRLGKGKSETVNEFVKKLMAFNKAKDGKLTKAELTDTRLHALFDRADTNKDGVVTREELEALFTREALSADAPKGKGKDGKGPKAPPPSGGAL
jgi:hypothetical protein